MSKQKKEDHVWLTPAELVERWRGKPSIGTLKNWRTAKKGPRFTQIGERILYRIDHVEEYENEMTVGGSDA